MKTIIIVVLVIVVGLAILGGGLGSFMSNVGEGTQKIKQSEQVQEIKEQISSKIESKVAQVDNSIESVPKAPVKKCDPSYPDVCITPYPPDLDCGEIPYHDFKVIQPDSHGFDRDKDGIGCES